MNADLLVLLLAALCNLVLSGFVFLRNSTSKVNRLFGLFGLSIILWTTCNFGADHIPSYTLLLCRLTLLSGAAIFTSLFALCTLFPSPKAQRPSWRWFYALSALSMLFCLTPLYVASARGTAHGAELSVGPLYTFYILYMALAVVWSMRILLRSVGLRSRTERSQTWLFAIGIIIGSSLAFLTNLLLPLFVNSWALSHLGPIFTIPFVAITAYAIARHHLFDIRWTLVRTAGFVLTIGGVSLAYALLILGVAAPLTTNGRVTLFSHQEQLLLLLPFTILVGLTFSSIQRVLARATRRVFYQDFYDTQQVLDALSDALISENDLEPIMASGLKVLADAVKPVFAVLVVLDDQGGVYAAHAINHQPLAELEPLIEHARHAKRALYSRDETRDWPIEYQRTDIALALRLGQTKRLTGVIFFGPKQNGHIYTRQDTELLGVSAKNVGIAIENAKKYQQITAFADTLKVEVERATANLRRANTKLRTLDALKDDFISMASHQLRSPAASVHDAIKMLEQSYITPAERTKIVELADASSERLVNVVTDMLSVARIQAGHFDLERTTVDMVELAERTVLQARALAEEKKISLRIVRHGDPLTLKADRAKLIEVMSNYVENAIRYGNESSEVLLEVRRDGRRVYFEVRDHGIGVPKDEQKHLFGKFFRASNARKEQPNGNGIGLFVVKTIARAHGGDAYYRPLPDGSAFGFWLKS